jgi:hypothetical protein
MLYFGDVQQKKEGGEDKKKGRERGRHATAI